MTSGVCNGCVLFLFEAGEKIGLGHWVRCIALMQELQQGHPCIQCIGMTNPLDPVLKRELEHSSLFCVENHEWSAAQVLDIAKQFCSTCIVLDLLDTSVAFVTELKPALRVISIGGSGDGRDYVHVRIDGMIERPGFSEGFRGEKLFLGTEYVILRKSFQDCKPIPIRNHIANVLIALGGDVGGHGLMLARLINRLNNAVQIRVILGPLARRTDETLPKGLQLCYDVADPIPLMRESDLAVTSGGMTTYELLRLGVPTIIVPTVEAQVMPAVAFDERGVAKYIGRINEDQTSLFAKLKEAWKLLASTKERRVLSREGRSLVDGRGLQRVSRIIREEVTETIVP